MGYLFTRQQLYELVWTSPVTTLAKSLAVSDVGLAKACRRGDIPLPPRYWAKLNAGQRMTRTPLPPRAPGASDRVAVGAGRPQTFRADGNEDIQGNDGDGVKRDELPPPLLMTKRWMRSRRRSGVRCPRNSASCAHWTTRIRRYRQ
jgi:hypothetical protein